MFIDKQQTGDAERNVISSVNLLWVYRSSCRHMCCERQLLPYWTLSASTAPSPESLPHQDWVTKTGVVATDTNSGWPDAKFKHVYHFRSQHASKSVPGGHSNLIARATDQWPDVDSSVELIAWASGVIIVFVNRNKYSIFVKWRHSSLHDVYRSLARNY